MSYKHKYLKYKLKYYKLKGGGAGDERYVLVPASYNNGQLHEHVSKNLVLLTMLPKEVNETYFKDGELVSYDGGRDENNEPHGNGKLIDRKYTEYSGEWQYGNRHGEGMMIIQSWISNAGDVHGESSYNGEWENDMRHGNGELIYSNGNKYTGEWEYDEQKNTE